MSSQETGGVTPSNCWGGPIYAAVRNRGIVIATLPVPGLAADKETLEVSSSSENRRFKRNMGVNGIEAQDKLRFKPEYFSE
jgi:hypothetical protein